MTAVLRAVWAWVRAVSGDSAYDAYAGHQRSHGRLPVSRADFYVETLGKRYSTTSRCC